MRHWIKKILVITMLLFSIASISHASMELAEGDKYKITITGIPYDTTKIELIALDITDRSGQNLVLESYLPSEIKDSKVEITIKPGKYENIGEFELIDCKYGIRFKTNSEEKTIEIKRYHTLFYSLEAKIINKIIVERTYDYNTGEKIFEKIHHTYHLSSIIFAVLLVGSLVFCIVSIFKLLFKKK